MNILGDPGIAIYISLAVALAVWAGVFAYLWRLDRVARELHRRLENQPTHEQHTPPAATLERRSPTGEPPARHQDQQPDMGGRHEIRRPPQ